MVSTLKEKLSIVQYKEQVQSTFQSMRNCKIHFYKAINPLHIMPNIRTLHPKEYSRLFATSNINVEYTGWCWYSLGKSKLIILYRQLSKTNKVFGKT